MYTVMITGGIGSGKSYAAAYLQSQGASLLSLDAISRDLLKTCEPMKREIADAFGRSVLDEEGDIIPAQLAYLAFATPDAVEMLNSITFPYIQDQAARYIYDSHCSPLSQAPVLVVEVPLLAQVPEFAALADEVIAIEAPFEERMMRAVERGMDYDDACARDDLQATDNERRMIADTIITNNTTLADFEHELSLWWNLRQASNWEVSHA